jgi:hypothetical protein
MKVNTKAIVVLVSGAILLSAVPGQTNPATLLNESGTSILADSYHSESAPEAITVSWSVVENALDIYTYSYTVNNPAGDVLLNNEGQPTSTPEIVDSYSLGFDTTFPGAYLSGSQTGGIYQQDNGTGLKWFLSPVAAGEKSGPLSFESYLPPTPGDANAMDANPPSPWASIPAGQPVPIPRVPDSTATITLLAGVLLLLPFRSTLLGLDASADRLRCRPNSRSK